MRHRNSVKKLGRKTAHRRAMLGNMATSLFKSYAIVTTLPRARVLRSVAEKMITLGKRGDLHARRLVARRIKDKVILQKLFEEIAPQFATRPGGYTRITKIGQRLGDAANICKVELLIAPTVKATDDKDKKPSGKKKDSE